MEHANIDTLKTTENLYPHDPDYGSPPGETLCDWMEGSDVDTLDMAERTGLDYREVERIVTGERAIDTQLAVVLETVTGIPARFWLNLERNYRARLEVNDDKPSL